MSTDNKVRNRLVSKAGKGAKGGADKGLIFSLVFHAAVFSTAVFGLPDMDRDLDAVRQPVSVEIIRIEKERVSEEKQEAEVKAPESEPEPEQRSVAKDEAPAALTPDAVPTLEKSKPQAVPTPKPRKKPELTAQQKLVAKVRPRSKPKPPKRFDVNKLSEYIDRSIEEEKPEVKKPVERDKKQAKTSDSKPKKDVFEGLEGRLRAASITDAIRVKLENCWNRPKGLKNSETMAVAVRMFLNSQGGLAKMPEILDDNYTDPSQPFRQVFGESVMRAITTCGTFEEAVPLIKEGNRYFDITFRPPY